MHTCVYGCSRPSFTQQGVVCTLTHDLLTWPSWADTLCIQKASSFGACSTLTGWIQAVLPGLPPGLTAGLRAQLPLWLRPSKLCAPTHHPLLESVWGTSQQRAIGSMVDGCLWRCTAWGLSPLSSALSSPSFCCRGSSQEAS